MRGLDGITFDATGLTLHGDRQNMRIWTTADGDQVGLFDFPPQPDVRPVAAELDKIRAKSRAEATKHGGAIVEVDLCTIAGHPGIREILKMPRKPAGMSYSGAFSLPLPDEAYLLTVTCFERGITGLRDTAIFTKLLQTGEIRVGEDGVLPANWMCDPYDPAITGPPARTRADDEAYDALFPEHPLSRVRALLRQIGGSLRLDGAAAS
jgi:hypothetical protein